MAIRYYPNRVYRARLPKVDRDMAAGKIYTVDGYADISSTALSATVSSDTDWKFHSAAFEFSGATARNYSVIVKNGRKVVENLNDYMWIWHSSVGKELVTLTPGFYNGTELAAELKAQLDTVFSPITWTVAYVNTTGLFTITPSAGTVKYLNTTGTRLSTRDSISGHLFGFEEDSSAAAAISNDTPVFGLNIEIDLYSITGGVLLTDSYTVAKELSIDQAIKLKTSVASVEVGYVVTYEKSINGEPYAN